MLQKLGLMYPTYIACPPEAFHYLSPHQALLEGPASIGVFPESRKIRRKKRNGIKGKLVNIFDLF